MKKLPFFIFLLFLFQFNILKSDTKLKIIEKINNSESLKFDFIQSSFNNEESGVCYLKRPHFLKCSYNDKKQKQLIINKKSLVILHKRYNKIYFYPLSKSYFLEILDKEKFSQLIHKGNLILKKDFFEIEFYAENKGKIIFYFDRKKFDISGWKIIDLNNNSTNFQITNLNKNQEIDKKLFTIPSFN
tara:strand:+ start:8562 stop:9122 length:561 start_codon:yes stop_codon:yes gene_type:complete